MNGFVIAGLLLVVAAAIIQLYAELKKFKVVHYTIPMQGVAGQGRNKAMGRVCRFVLLADLHNNSFGRDNERLLKAIHSEKPDFIVCAGDMLVAKPGYSMETAKKLMKALSQKYPVYYGSGNHEYRLRIYPERYGTMYEEYRKAMDSYGIHYLENASETLDYNGTKIRMTGLEIDRYYYKRFRNIPMEPSYIESEVGKKTNLYTILIAHNPMYFPAYAEWGAQLTLSGHVHGGLVRIPRLGGLLSPQIRFFPKYDGGLYRMDGKYMILSRGLGTHTIPVRICNRAELIVVDLVK